MKVFAYILVSCAIILFITGCHIADNSIGYYIDHYCDFSKNDTCYSDGKIINDQGYFVPSPIFMVVEDKQNLEYDIYALAF